MLSVSGETAMRERKEAILPRLPVTHVMVNRDKSSHTGVLRGSFDKRRMMALLSKTEPSTRELWDQALASGQGACMDLPSTLQDRASDWIFLYVSPARMCAP